MRRKVSIVLLVSLLAAAVAIAGCTSSSGNGEASPTTTPTQTAPTPTPVPAIGSTLSVNSMLDLSQVHWYEYLTKPTGTVVDLGSGFTTAGASMTERWDFNVSYEGQSADQVSGTGTYPGNNGAGTTYAFLDPADHTQFLGGNMTVTKNGNVVYHGSITASLLAIQSLLDMTNSTYSGPHTVTYDGTQTVTVPLGTYSTTAYAYNGTYNLTVYTNPSVPIPVKIMAVSPAGTTYDIELMGWG